MYLILPFTKGHFSNKDNYLAEGVSLLKRDYCICNWVCHQQPPGLRDHVVLQIVGRGGGVFPDHFYCILQHLSYCLAEFPHRYDIGRGVVWWSRGVPVDSCHSEERGEPPVEGDLLSHIWCSQSGQDGLWEEGRGNHQLLHQEWVSIPGIRTTSLVSTEPA